MTKKRLAEETGLSVRSISAYESGSQEPSDDSLRAIARAVGFPLAFFDRDDPEEIPPSSASFRALSRMTAAQRRSAVSAASLAVELNNWVEERFDLPRPDIPDLRELGATEAAETLRTEWRLGERPIGNMVHLLESKGARVFSLPEEVREVDAFSWWEGRQPFIFLNLSKTYERGRFDAAHELGHLVLHQHGAPNGQEAEAEAHQFAAAFLMPYASFRATAPQIPTVRGIVKAKERWGVSAMAYARRLKETGLLSDWKYYKEICKRLSWAGFRSSEPDSNRQRETSELLRKVFATLRQDGIARHQIARELGLVPQELDRLVFGLVMTSIEGGNQQAENDSVPNLRLVTQ